jgi:hypothetical protein
VRLTCASTHVIIFYIKNKEEEVQSIISRQAVGVRVDNFEVKKGLTKFPIRGIRQPISYDSSPPDNQGVSSAGG